MRGVVAVAVSLLIALGSSGCFVEEDDPETQDTDSPGAGSTGTTTGTRTGTTSASTATSGGSTDGTSGSDSAPTAGLTASALEGEAPLNVTFAVNGTDADGDALSWALTVGNTTIGNGTEATLPSNVTHQFTEAGNFTVVLTVTDGAFNATANVTVTVTASAGEEAPATVEDDWVVFNPDGTCDAKGEVSFVAGYVHHRGGDSVWLYEESNGVAGLQVGGSGPAGSDTNYVDCLNPDALIF